MLHAPTVIATPGTCHSQRMTITFMPRRPANLTSSAVRRELSGCDACQSDRGIERPFSPTEDDPDPSLTSRMP
jgi:hypothetical protein